MEMEELRKRLGEIQEELDARQKAIVEEMETEETSFKASKTQLGKRLTAERTRLAEVRKAVEAKKQGMLERLQGSKKKMETAKAEQQTSLKETERSKSEQEKKIKGYKHVLEATIEVRDQDLYTSTKGKAKECKKSVEKAMDTIRLLRKSIGDLEQRLVEIDNVIQEVEESTTERIAPSEMQEIEQLEQTIENLEKEFDQKYGELAEQQSMEDRQAKAREEQEKANREAQEARQQIEVELQTRQEEIQKQLGDNAEAIEKARTQIKKQQETREFYQRASKFYIDEEAKLNGEKQQEIEQCETAIATAEEQIRNFEAEIEQLNSEAKAIEDLLNEMKVSGIENSQDQTEQVPQEPVQPQQPTEPEQPKAPEEPVEPQQSTKPEQPKAPEEPVNPNPVQLTGTSSRPQGTIQQNKAKKVQEPSKPQQTVKKRTAQLQEDIKEKKSNSIKKVMMYIPNMFNKFVTYIKEKLSMITRKRIEAEKPINQVGEEYSQQEIESLYKLYRDQYANEDFDIEKEDIPEQAKEIIRKDMAREKEGEEALEKFQTANKNKSRNNFLKSLQAKVPLIRKEQPNGSYVRPQSQVEQKPEERKENQRIRPAIYGEYIKLRMNEDISPERLEKFIQDKKLTEDEAQELRKEHQARSTVIKVDPKDTKVLDEDGKTIMTLGDEDEIGG